MINQQWRVFGLSDLDSLPKTSDELIEVFEGAKIQEDNECTNEDSIADGEQLTLDIENAIDGAHNEAANENQAKESSENENAVEEIRKYKELLDSGIITEEEFSAKKRQLMGL